MSDHIPTTKFIREAANVNGSIGVSYSEFDHWMEAHDREVAAQALRDAADEWSEWETFTASDGNKSIRMHGLSPDQWLRARADGIERDQV